MSISNLLVMKNTLCKHGILWIFIHSIFLLSPLFAQINEDDPLRNSRNLIKEQEVMLTYSEISLSTPGTTTLRGIAFKPNTNNNTFTELKRIDARSQGTSNTSPSVVASATGNFFGEQYGDGIVHAYIGKAGSQSTVVFRIDLLSAFDGGSTTSLTSVNSLVFVDIVADFNGNSQVPQIDLVVGNFDADKEDELVVLYNDVNNRVAYKSYDLTLGRAGNGVDFTATLKQSNILSPANNDVKLLKNFAATAFDMNADGLDELGVIYNEGSSIVFRNLKVRTNNYQFDIGSPPRAVLSRGTDCTGSGTFNFSSMSMDLAAGDLEVSLPGEELVVAAHFDLTSGIGSAGQNKGLYVIPLSNQFTTGGSFVLVDPCDGTTPNYYTYSSFLFSDERIAVDVASGDLDGDLDDEVVVATSSRIFVLNGGVRTFADGFRNLSLTLLTDFNVASSFHTLTGGEANYADNMLAVGNIDPLSGNFGSNFRAEILIGKNIHLISDPINNDITQSFKLTAYGFNESGSQGAINWSNPVIKAEKTAIAPRNSGYKIRRFSVAFGDTDGGSVILGNPTRTEISEILNPSLILNAPPTHFDVFDQQTYDVCNLYDVGQSPPSASVNHFYSEYEEILNESFSFSSNFTTDWAVSGSVEAGFAAGGFSLGGKLTHTYGERFAKIAESSIERTITQTRTALKDDELLAYLVDYSIFEYPVFRLGETTALTHVAVVVPKNVRETFTGARSPIHTYKSSHQHGNLFSYPSSITDLDVSQNATQVFDGTLKSQEIKKGSGFNASFEVSQAEVMTEGVETEVSTNTTLAANIGGAFKGFGLSASVEGSYSTSDLQTRSSSYREEVKLKGFLGEGEGSTIPGDYPYVLTPLVYWNSEGALVMDYLVDINKSGFWQSFYDKPDASFLLTDPHKTQKGIESPSTYNNTDRYKTRDIIFDKRPTPGAAINITARIHNYGFSDIPANTLDVAFYYVDPDGTDTLESIGLTVLSEGILGRDNGFDKTTISIPWTVPANIGPNSKIVAIIDPSNNLPNEVHDYPNGNGVSNNIGWTCLLNPNCNVSEAEAIFYPDGITSTDDELMSQLKINAFPNPFKDRIKLEIGLETPQNMTIEIFDLQGRVLYQKSNILMTPGKSSLEISTTGWAEGMYIYKVSGEGFHKASRIALKR